MIQLGEPLNRKKTIRCQSCGDRVLYVLHDRKSGDMLRFHDVRFLQASQMHVKHPLYCSKCDSPWINKSTGRLILCGKDDSRSLRQTVKATEIKASISNQNKKPLMAELFDYPDTRKVKEIKNVNYFINHIKSIDKKFKVDDKDKLKQISAAFSFCNPIKSLSIKQLLEEDKQQASKSKPSKPSSTKAKKRTGYKADRMIIDECADFNSTGIIIPKPGKEISFKEIVKLKPQSKRKEVRK